ncbi:MAG: PilT/PilU family type 4a pilus ATPase [Parcubacteria group bacterium]|nr:PilT/PilU family type 4a pilus ATPase [Parcubacteria group bacterium]
MENYQREIEDLLLLAAEQGASDLHIAPGRYPTLRIDGELVQLTQRAMITPESSAGLCLALMDEEKQERFKKNKEIDFAFGFKDKVRFRTNVYVQRGYFSAALRLISHKIRTLEELGLPKVLRDFTRPSQGFVIVSGPTGHGKSTTLAALIDEINHKRGDHIITIEDPIEYLFAPDKAMIEQREVGSDTLSFRKALRSVFRQDADVVMLGEMRDLETISTAVTAAETGHLIFATLHTNSASQTIDRIIDSFPPEQQSQIRLQLAGALLGVVSQRLVPRVDGGLVAAVEVLIANYAVRNLIRENKLHQLDLVIETSTDKGMISLNKSLSELVRQGQISLENAEIYSLNPSELTSMLSH